MTVRSDNADLRLTQKGLCHECCISTFGSSCTHGVRLICGCIPCSGRDAGVISNERWSHFTGTRDEVARVTALLKDYKLSPQVRYRSIGHMHVIF